MIVTLDVANSAVVTLLRDMERLNLVRVKAGPDAVLPTEPGEQADEPREKRAGGFGCLKGQIWMADDFDAPLDDFKDYSWH
jgi:hypothetical protein